MRYTNPRLLYFTLLQFDSVRFKKCGSVQTLQLFITMHVTANRPITATVDDMTLTSLNSLTTTTSN